MVSGLSCTRNLLMPLDSNWKMPVVSQDWNTFWNVYISSSGGWKEVFSKKLVNISGNTFFSFSYFFFRILMQFLMMERFLSPRKSILSSQMVSSAGPSYWLMIV